MPLRPPAGALCISTVDMHTGGEPLRIVTDGLPELEGRTVLEKRRYFRERFDHLRTGLMLEPRGHADMYGAILTRSADADFDVFFLHNEGYSTMCGHAIIALTKFVIEAGLVDKSDVSFNVPAGRIEARAHSAGGHNGPEGRHRWHIPGRRGVRADGIGDRSGRGDRRDAHRLRARRSPRRVRASTALAGLTLMDPQHLVAMVNEIAAFFAGEDPGKAAENVANHLRRYWDPRMRKQILEHAGTGGEGLSQVARAGVELIPR